MAKNLPTPNLQSLFEAKAGTTGYVFCETGQYLTADEYHLIAVMMNNRGEQFIEHLARVLTSKRINTLQDLYLQQGKVLDLLEGLQKRQNILFGGKYEVKIMKPEAVSSMSFWWASIEPIESRKAALRLVHDIDSPEMGRNNIP